MRAGVLVQGATLHSLVDHAHELFVLRIGCGCVAARHRRLQPPEVRLDRRRVAPVLQALALAAQDPLLL